MLEDAETARPDEQPADPERDRPDHGGPARASGRGARVGAEVTSGKTAADLDDLDDLDELLGEDDEGPGSDPRRAARAAERDAGPGGSWRALTEGATEDAGPSGRPPRSRAH